MWSVLLCQRFALILWEEKKKTRKGIGQEVDLKTVIVRKYKHFSIRCVNMMKKEKKKFVRKIFFFPNDIVGEIR